MKTLKKKIPTNTKTRLMSAEIVLWIIAPTFGVLIRVNLKTGSRIIIIITSITKQDKH